MTSVILATAVDLLTVRWHRNVTVKLCLWSSADEGAEQQRWPRRGFRRKFQHGGRLPPGVSAERRRPVSDAGNQHSEQTTTWYIRMSHAFEFGPDWGFQL